MTDETSIDERINFGNIEMEKSWKSFIDCAVITGDDTSRQYGLQRLIAYNPSTSIVKKEVSAFGIAVDTITFYIRKILGQALNDKENAKLWGLLGYLYFLLRDFPNAMACYTHAISIDPYVDDPYFWFCRAILLTHFTFYPEAIGAFEQITKCTHKLNNNEEFKYRYGLILVTQCQPRCTDTLTALLTHPPPGLTKDDILLQIGYHYQVNMEIDQANQIYESIYLNHPLHEKFLEHYLWFLSFQMSEDRLRHALNIYNAVEKKFSNNPIIRVAASRVMLKLDKISEAYEGYKQCRAYWAEHFIFWFDLGIVYFKNSQFEEAEDAFNKSIFMKPNFKEGILNFILTVATRHEDDRLSRLIENLKKQCPDLIKMGDSLYSADRQITFCTNSNCITQLPTLESRRFLESPPKIPCEFGDGDPDFEKAYEMLTEFPYSLFKDDIR